MRILSIYILFSCCTMVLPGCGRDSKDRRQADAAPGVVADIEKDMEEQALVNRGIQRGDEIAALAQQALAKKLKGALTEGGVEYAIRFCQLNAYPILDSVREETGAHIRRVTLKARNPEDKPDAIEARMLDQYTSNHEPGRTQPAHAVMLEDQDMLLYTKPIVIDNALCLVCHGIPGEALTPETSSIIGRHYPEDEATGYSQGDLRGMWSIRLPREALRAEH